MAAYATMAAIPTSYPVLVFPADGRAPHIADMPVTQAGPDYYAYPLYAPAPALVPRPEIHMEYIAEGLGQPAHRSVRVDALAGMTGKLTRPYMIFYPAVSRDGMPFPPNKCVREIQAGRGLGSPYWCGDLVVAAYSDATYGTIVSAKISDFPIIKNYFMTSTAPSA